MNQRDQGFDKVINFIQTSRPDIQSQVIEDLEISQENESTNIDLREYVEELRIEKRMPFGRELVMLCYDENTEGQIFSTTQNHRWPSWDDKKRGEEWQWLTPALSIENAASRKTSEQVQEWMVYGGIALAVSVIFQLIAIFLSV